MAPFRGWRPDYLRVAPIKRRQRLAVVVDSRNEIVCLCKLRPRRGPGLVYTGQPR